MSQGTDKFWGHRNLISLPLYFCLCTSQKEFNKEWLGCGLPKEKIEPYVTPGKDATVVTVEHKGSIISFVGVANWEGKDPIAICGLLVHEAMHIWQRTLQMMGEENPSEEFETYSVQAIASELMYLFRLRIYGH